MMMLPTTDYRQERKGSLLLRGNHANYSRAVKTSNWHQARQAEPKDNDLNKIPKRTLHHSTYNELGSTPDWKIPLTSYTDHVNQIFLKPLYDEHPTFPMVRLETLSSINLDRETQLPLRGYGAVLPRHHPDYYKFYDLTTYNEYYVPPYPYVHHPYKVEVPDNLAAYKKCNSQFTDVTDYRRPGKNNWWDESGIYANSHYKKQLKTEHTQSENFPKI